MIVDPRRTFFSSGKTKKKRPGHPSTRAFSHPPKRTKRRNPRSRVRSTYFPPFESILSQHPLLRGKREKQALDHAPRRRERKGEPSRNIISSSLSLCPLSLSHFPLSLSLSKKKGDLRLRRPLGLRRHKREPSCRGTVGVADDGEEERRRSCCCGGGGGTGCCCEQGERRRWQLAVVVLGPCLPTKGRCSFSPPPPPPRLLRL